MNRHSSENTPHLKPEKDDHFLKNEEHFLEKENNSWHFQQKSTKTRIILEKKLHKNFKKSFSPLKKAQKEQNEERFMEIYSLFN